MIPLLRAELLKLRTTRTFFALVAVAVVLSLLIVVLTTLIDEGFREDDVRSLFTADFSSLFILLLGVIGMAGEWRHRTITGTVLAAPRRTQLLGAKVLSYAIAGAVLSLTVTVTVMAVGSIILSSQGETTIGIADLLDVLWRNLAVAGFLGALGACIGALVRNQIIAIIGLLIFSFVIEPTVLGLAPEVGKFGPTVGAPNGIVQVDVFDSDDALLALVPALLVMTAWVGIFFAAAAAVLRERDLV